MALLDFGASRSYDDKFIEKYIEIIKSAMDGDRGKVLSLSQEMGFLTGYESKVNLRGCRNTIPISLSFYPLTCYCRPWKTLM